MLVKEFICQASKRNEDIAINLFALFQLEILINLANEKVNLR